MKKRMQRAVALLLSGVLLCAGVGCGTQTELKKSSDAQTETINTDGYADGKEAETALSLMKAVNTKEPIVSEDNYRTYYEVFVYSFYDSDGDGIGDLKGLTEKLDYINDGDPTTDTDLGCDGIWLMPIMPSTTYHKYDVTDYCNIDEEYGTLDDFDVFMKECHNRGIRVIIDLVMNHSSTKHVWFQTAAEYLKQLPEGAEPDLTECPYVDYYHFSKEKLGGYCQLAGTDWYYEAQFWSEMPDLNLGSEAVRDEFSQIVDFWLDRGVDGFRLDAAKEYYSGNASANVEVLTWFDDMVEEKNPDAYIVAEVWTDMNTYAQYYESGIDSCFNFAFAEQSGVITGAVRGSGVGGAKSYGTSQVRLQEVLDEYSDSYIDAPFYTNHDTARGAGYYAGDYGENQVKISQAMNLLMTGSAFLYYGEELGMKGSGKDENKRAPMNWSDDANAEGMCKGPADMEEIDMIYGSLEEQQGDGDSIYNFVKETIRLRNSYPAIMRGKVTVEEELSDENVCVLRKTYEDQEVLLAFNLSKDEQSVDLTGITLANGSDTCNLTGVLLTSADDIQLEQNMLTLPAYSAAILE